MGPQFQLLQTWKARLFGACLFLLAGYAGASQQNTFSFTNYTTASGLPDNYILSIIQDSRGFMWFGTKEGLSRFDGSGFRNFFAGADSTNQSLKENAITFLKEYQPGHLVFTCSGQLLCLNTFTQVFYSPPSFENRKIFRLSSGPARYYASSLDTCFVLNNQLQIIKKLVPPFKDAKNIATAYELNDTTIIIGYIREYFLYNTRTEKYTKFNIEPALLDGQRFFNFQYYDAKRNWLYFSNFYSGLLCYDLQANLIHHWKAGKLPEHIPESNISFVNRKSENELWIGTIEGGLFTLNVSDNRLDRVLRNIAGPSSLLSNTIEVIYKDKEQNTWFGTAEGVSKINASSSFIKSWHSVFQPAANGSNLLHIIKGADGNMYQTISNLPYCYRINSKTGEAQMLDSARLPKIWCIGNMGQDIVFGGLGLVITRYNPVTEQYTQSDFLKKYFPESELVILAFKQKNGEEWFSGNHGGGFVRRSADGKMISLYKKDGPHGHFTISYYARCVEDIDGDLWFGVNKSEKILHWDHLKDRFNEISFDTVKGVGSGIFTGISDLLMDNRNNIWVAYEGSGLLEYNISAHTARRYLIGDGLQTNFINSIVFDGNNRLWVGTGKGLNCFLINEHKFLSYTEYDGLPEGNFYENCSYFDSSSGNIWMGAKNTLMRFKPDALLGIRNKKIPVYLDVINVNGKAWQGDALASQVFEPDQNNFQFHFTGIDIEDGKDLEYSYQLGGADKSWVTVGKITTASYANLNPGTYKFLVRTKHKGDIDWSLTSTPFAFVIKTPWFRTWWFSGILLVGLAFIVWYIIRSYYKGKLEKEKNLLERKQAIEKERTRIATDMHDDFGANLSRIKFISEKIQLNNDKNEALNKDLVKISEFSDEMAEKMNEIVWALNQRYDTLEDLISFTRAYASGFLEEKNIRLIFSSNIQSNIQLNGECRRNVFLVVKECLNNVYKHAHASKVELHFIQKNLLWVTVKDDGVGIDLENIRPFANGLENMKRRMEGMGGSVTVEVANGTLVCLKAPI